ncbi:MAG: DHH family phosphoesterase [Desulfovibrionaceae bacterium]
MVKPSKLIIQFQEWCHSLDKADRWCIMITADPDALGAAMALRRLLSRRAPHITIARTNEVTRPDNLAMIRYLRIPVEAWQPEMRENFTHFAMVDSQPHHNIAFEGIPFSLVIDHHPLLPEHPVNAAYTDIRPEYGATCTMMARYFHALKIRPSRLLSTGMLYGIRTDTAAFERSGGMSDLQAYQWLSRHADTTILRRILRSEYLQEWLPLFSRAFRSLHACPSGGAHAHVSEVNSPDLLVAIADFFTRVHGLKWVAVSGVYNETVIIIFRGDGSRDMGVLAAKTFQCFGSAGGHRTLARAEFPCAIIKDGLTANFVLERLKNKKKT